MSDTHVRDDDAGFLSGGDTITSFAGRVLDVLVDRSRRTTTALRADLVSALADGMVTQDEALIEQTLAAFRRACISPMAMVDVYVPAAARHLGVAWSADRMSFAEVTIATGRLQALVRAIGTRWGGDISPVPGRRSILMIVPDAEQHTLGAVIAAGQLRQMGLSVCLRLGPSRADILGLLRTRNFDAAMISVGDQYLLDVSRKLIELLRIFGPKGLPVVIGGCALDGDRDLRALTGADYGTQDITEAAAFCCFADRPIAVVPQAGRVVSLHG